MGYDLSPRNKDVESFHFGAFSFPILLEACGYLWPMVQNGGKWYCAFGIDPRMPEGDSYPQLISNDGFHVTAEEARIMARVASNYVAIQRSLPAEQPKAKDLSGQAEFGKEDVLDILMRGMSGRTADPWPSKIREDFVDRFAEFAEWAPKTGGFRIW